MRKSIAVLALAAVTAGCGQKITAAEARNAVPDQSRLLIDTPKDAADATAAIAAKPGAASVAAVASEPAFQPGFLALTNSDYARWSYVTAWTVNGGTWWTLKLVHAITRSPATDCSVLPNVLISIIRPTKHADVQTMARINCTGSSSRTPSTSPASPRRSTCTIVHARKQASPLPARI